MAMAVFKCCNTGLHVQVSFPDLPRYCENAQIYQSVRCIACDAAHMVDPKTGKTLRPRKSSDELRAQ